MYRLPERGVTRVDAMVLGLIAILLAGFFWPIFNGRWVHERAPSASCMNNIRQIGLAMIQYAGDHDDRFSPLVDEQGRLVPAVDNEGRVSMLPSRTAFAVLMKEGYLSTTRVFVCWSSGDRNAEGFPKDMKNAPLQSLVLAEKNCSYGWDPTKRHDVSAVCAIIADAPPSGVSVANAGTAKNNSANHKGSERLLQRRARQVVGHAGDRDKGRPRHLPRQSGLREIRHRREDREVTAGLRLESAL